MGLLFGETFGFVRLQSSFFGPTEVSAGNGLVRPPFGRR